MTVPLRGVVLLAIALSGCTALPSADERVGTDLHLFVDPLHAAAGTCFPRFHLELWSDDTRLRNHVSTRSPLKPVVDVPPCDPRRIQWDKLQAYFRTPHRAAPPARSGERFAWKPPLLAMSLEGGGSKSAPFALGALAGLHETGLLNDVDIVSSVSGGSYAAYFYFSRLLDATRAAAGDSDARNPNEWFRDCIPNAYSERFPERTGFPRRNFCSSSKRGVTRDSIEGFRERFPYQAHIRYYQDVIHWMGGLEEVDQSFRDRFWTWTNIGVLATQSVVTSVPHFVFSSLFSGPDNSSPSRLAYRVGIERAYGHSYRSWGGITSGRPEPAGGEYAELGFVRDARMSDLASIIGTNPCSSTTPCAAPLWIVNAAGSSGRDLTNWLTTPATDALRANFEMTPFGQGSGLYGYLNEPVALALRDVVGSSAAFLDRDQREFGLGNMRFVAGAVISAFNLEWGTDIPNYNATDKARALARITPIPFYHVPGERQRFSPMIHLADGGNTDNLGVLAGLRRGARNIIVVASTGDGTGTMESLCRAKNHLELDGAYRVDFAALGNLGEVCNRQITARELVVWGEAALTRLVCGERKSDAFCRNVDGDRRWNPEGKSELGYDMWDWPIPVIPGDVVRNAHADVPESLVARIYLVKPALYHKAVREQVVREGTSGHPEKLCDLGDEYEIRTCTAPVERRDQRKPLERTRGLPCASLAFAIGPTNACLDRRGHDHHGEFPQNDVVFTTLNSSYTLFGAYYDLARHVTSQIGWEDAGNKQWLKVPPSQDPRRTTIEATGGDKPRTSVVQKTKK